MKNSNSRDKNMRTQAPIQSQPANKLMKTDIHQPKRQEMERTQYNRPTSSKKIESYKNIPPKGPVSKKQFVIEDHMTQSCIYQAKQGLQLLKKKMSSKGMSKEKIIFNNDTEKPIPSLKTVSSHKIEDNPQYENRNNNMPPRRDQKFSEENEGYSKKRIPPSSSTHSSKIPQQTKTTPQNQRKQPLQPQYKNDYDYRNQEMQAPIQPKKDFNALLEEQLRKQKQGGYSNNSMSNKPAKNTFNQSIQYPDQGDVQLVECRHCQRTFNSNIIAKHEKICVKVFQQKRKAFDSAAYRAPQVEGFNQPPVVQSKKTEPPKATKKQVPPPPSKKQQQIPKWKAASLAFRANMKQAKGQALSQQEKQATDIAQGMVQCNYCGRKFNSKAAARHISFCQTKSKQIPRMNVKKK